MSTRGWTSGKALSLCPNLPEPPLSSGPATYRAPWQFRLLVRWYGSGQISLDGW